MSASRYVDYTVTCDHDGCVQGMHTSELPWGATTADVRSKLERHGWTVAVRAPDAEWGAKRLDYCPDHKPASAG